ncbi:TPA: ATPase, T2SS/T4P/T4SS family [Streptococcus agalactiae]
MVQSLAKHVIHQAVEVNAQDIYIIPKGDCYELYMRIDDERRFIDVFEFNRMASLISHFKFVAGMNVGEKRRSQLGSLTMNCQREDWFHYDYQVWEIIVVKNL